MAHLAQNKLGASSDEETRAIAASDEAGQGYLSGPGLEDHLVSYEVIDGHCFHEGCIDLGPIEQVQAEAERIRAKREHVQTVEAAGNEPTTDDKEVQQGVGISPNSSYLWGNAVLPYTIASSVPDQNRVTDAIKHIEANTGIRFVRRSSRNARRYPDYVEIISNGSKGWSSSSVGMRKGSQTLRFADGHSWKILVHELLHALGMYHEQSRSDRDDYVKIKWDNIPDGPPPADEKNWAGNFQKKPNTVDYFAYDYNSIMHYRANAFAKDGSKPTIVPLEPGATIGQRDKMSYGDRQTIAKMYQKYFARGYAGVWRAGTGRYGLWVNASWKSFTEKWQQWSKQGLRLHDIHVQKIGSRTLYSGVFLPGTGKHGLWANVSWSSFQKKWGEWSAQGLRLVDIHVHRSGNQNRYSGVFLPGTGAYALWVNSDWNNFKAKRAEFAKKNLRLTDIHVQHVGGKNRYSGVFLPGTGGHGLWASTSFSSFTSKWREWNKRGLRLVDLNLHKVGNTTRYSGVFLPGKDKYYLWANVTFEGLRAKWEELAGQGLRLVDFEITNPGDGASADAADFAFEGADDTPFEESMQEFGGIYGQDLPDSEPENSEPENTTLLEESGGGHAGGNLTDAIVEGRENVTDLEGQGDAYFPSEYSRPVESQHSEGLGGVVFDPASEDQPEEAGDYGDAIFPEDDSK